MKTPIELIDQTITEQTEYIETVKEIALKAAENLVRQIKGSFPLLIKSHFENIRMLDSEYERLLTFRSVKRMLETAHKDNE